MSLPRPLKAALLYFAVAFGAGFALGAARVLWLAPRIGARAAELVEMPLLLGVGFAAAAWIVRRFALEPRPGPRLGMGLAALALLLAAELALVAPLRGLSAQYPAAPDPVTAAAYYTALALFALLPLFVPPAVPLRRRMLAALVAVVAAVPAGVSYESYRRELALERLRVSVGSELVQTACGPIEFASRGEGPVLLVVHGAGGGYDQGLDLAGSLAGPGLRVVAMSRFGYLRTPLPADASPGAQADAHACLLDALKIGRAAVLGVSAGAPSALQLALRHPARVTRLVLLVPLAYAPSEGRKMEISPAARFMYEWGIKSDLLFWVAAKAAPATVVRTVLGTPPGLLERAAPEERSRVEEIARHILPVSERQAGLLNEARIAASLARYDLGRIAAPTLVLSAADDLYGTYESGRYTAQQIPGARFVGYPDGGHALVGRNAQALTEIKAFLGARGSMGAVKP